MYRLSSLIVLALVANFVFADSPTPMTPVNPPETGKSSLSPETRAKAEAAIDRGLAFLAKNQGRDGGWAEDYRPAVTAIVARAFANDDDFGPRHDLVRRSLDYILRFQQSDGGIYERESNLANYETSVALMLLVDLNDPQQKDRIARAQAFLSALQFDAAESVDEDNEWFGGAGYNRSKRPDLSNTQMMLEALHESGLSKDHPVYQKALKFVSRCQMNEATNDQRFARGAMDGGFIYSPNAGGESKASQGLFEIGTPRRSYGSMTYSGFKSLLFAGVERDDPRVLACLNWIRTHYTLENNPGMPARDAKDGLYYYYHVFARALHAWGEPMVVDANGVSHNWRQDLCDKLLSLQRSDGRWENDARRWLESDSNYVTALSIRSLQIALDQ